MDARSIERKVSDASVEFAHPTESFKKTTDIQQALRLFKPQPLNLTAQPRKHIIRKKNHSNPELKRDIRHLFDALLLALMLKIHTDLKAHIHLGKWNWITYFAAPLLYFKFRDILNPVRDTAGFYNRFLYDHDDPEPPSPDSDEEEQMEPNASSTY